MKKKMSVYWGVTLLFLLTLPLLLTAIEKMFIIDFGQYEKRILKEYGSALTNTTLHNKKTGEPKFILNPSIMAISNWIVKVKSSGLRMKNIIYSQCLKVYSNEHKQDVLGVRINFPKTRQNDRAIIRPQFEFHAYNKDGKFTNLTNGVIMNVGVVKEISIWVKGRNYPYDIALRLRDSQNKIREYFFGNLNFDNWRKMTWVNPNYINLVKDRVIIRKPLYPKDIPYLKFRSFIVYRQMDQIGGDFILYIKNTEITYERYVDTIADPDIDDEKVWRIMRARALKSMKNEQKKLADKADIYRREDKRLKK